MLEKPSINPQEQQQLEGQAQQVYKHLKMVAKPLYRPDKGSSVAYASYAFGPSHAQTAQKALSYAAELQSALEQGDFEAALTAAQEIDNLFSQ